MEYKPRDLSKIHDCEKCRGKIVCIETDMLGNTYCAYCHQRVDYRMTKAERQLFLNKLKELNII